MSSETIAVQGTPVAPVVPAALWRSELEEAISFDLVAPTANGSNNTQGSPEDDVYIYQV